MKNLIKYYLTLKFIRDSLEQKNLENVETTQVKETLKKNYENELNLRDDITFMGSLIDLGQAQYQIEWQRLGTMQQSAGVLIGILGIVYAVIVTFLSLSGSVNSLTDTIYFRTILLPTLFIDVISTVISMICFFRMIWPKAITSLELPSVLFKKYNDVHLYTRFYESLKSWDLPLKELDTFLEERLNYYLYSLRFIGYSYTLILLFILTLMIRFIPYEFNFWIYYTIISFISIVYFMIVFKKLRRKK